MEKRIRHGSLFSGIGGFDLAAEWCGWDNVFHCEWNDFGRKVLNYYWPDAESFGDITKSDFTKYEGTVDVISGGFPCQPYSLAGKRKGKEDDRHLWPEMLRVIKEVKPAWVVGENVYGLINWSGGMVFHEIISDLEDAGYEVQSYLIPAVGVDAPHRRDRLWVVAYSADNGNRNRLRVDGIGETENIGRNGQSQSEFGEDGIKETSADTSGNGFHRCDNKDAKHSGKRGINAQCKFKHGNEDGNAPDTITGLRGGGSSVRQGRNDGERKLYSAQEEQTGNDLWGEIERCDDSDIRRDNANPEYEGLQGCVPESGEVGFAVSQKEKSIGCVDGRIPKFDNFPTQPPVCSGDDGVPPGLVGITVSKHRNESIKAYGNAVVPQVVYQIFKAIDDYERNILP